METERFLELCELSCLNVVLRQDRSLWRVVHDRCLYQSTSYLSSTIDYFLEYHRSNGGEWSDLSCVLYSDKNPVALWPITISLKDELVNLSSQGRELLPPIFTADCPNKTKKVISASALKLVELLCYETGLKRLVTTPAFDGSFVLSHWHSLLMKRGAYCQTSHNLYADLSRPIENIRLSFRKSYRSLISASKSIWNLELLSSTLEAEVWEEFRLLHLAMAGRATRSKESWDLQYRSVINGESFLVALRDDAGKMVGAGLFVTTRDEGWYAVGAYDRSYFDQPLGHVVQFRAIQEMKNRDCHWYLIGRRFYPADQPSPSEKELSISYFKEGFASHTVPSFSLFKNFL